MIASLEKINKFYNGTQVLDNVSLTVEDNDRIGLIGRNGCGKSTLLRILTGKELPDHIVEGDGSVFVSKSASVGYLEQNGGLDKNNTVIDEMKTVFSKLLSTEERLRELENEMHHSDNKAITDEYTRLSTWFEANEGYLIDVRIKTVLGGMGFDKDRYDSIISELSGGEKTRLAIAKLLLENPKLLILDEPTNHLDFKTVMWLEDYLQGYKGALLLVSHDRYFLDKLCTSVAEIERGRIRRYKGNYTAFTRQKEEAIARQQKEYDAQQAEIKRLSEFVDKNIVRATSASAAKSKRHAIERMELIEKPLPEEKRIHLDFEYDIVPPLDILSVRNIDLTVGDGEKTLADNVSFEVKRGEKVAFIGANGAGKSTMLKVLQNIIPHNKGYIDWAENVKISYFDQESANLNPENTVINELHNRNRSMLDKEIRGALGRVRLVGENVFKKVGVISGGERAKLCFAIMIEERGNVLILDEPTNHLDLVSKEELEEALCKFDQTILFVSHDRYLLNRLATRIIEIDENGIEDYPFGFAEYMQAQREKMKAEEVAATEVRQKSAEEKKTKVYRTKEQRSADAARKQRIKAIEKEIAELEEQQATLEKEITLPEVTRDYQLLNEKCMLIEEVKTKISDLSDEWIELSE